MAQLNLNLTPQFERDLKKLMKARKIARKSDAIRYAVSVASAAEEKRRDFSALLGAFASLPDNPNPRFGSEDALWDEK